MGRLVGYLKTSKNTQEMQEQKQAILDFAQREKITLSRFIEIFPSSQKGAKERKIDILLKQLEPGDTLIVSDISRIGWSVAEIIRVVDTLVKHGVRFVAIKEGIELNKEKQDPESQVMVYLFEMLASLESQLVSQRTKEALVTAKEKGKKLGRPKGSFGKSKLDGREAEIKRLLALEVSKASIAKITGVSWSTLRHFIQSRGLI
jgi:DNA invertase Pin-like site-specific DNA recombinase